MTTSKITLNALSRLVRDTHGLTRQESTVCVKAFFDTLIKVLVAEGEVSIPNTLKLRVRHKKARPGRNPKTGVECVIQARNTLTMSVSSNCGEPIGETTGHTSILFTAAKKEGCPLEVTTTIVRKINEALTNHVQLEIRGFGSIHYTLYPERNSRNPKTGEAIIAPPMVKALIRTSPSLLSVL